MVTQNCSFGIVQEKATTALLNPEGIRIKERRIMTTPGDRNSSSMVPPLFSAQYKTALTFLRGVVALVMLYALGMVVSGRTFAMTLFDLLNFGPAAHGLNLKGIDFSIFMFGVLGSVIFGWMVLMWFMTELAGDAELSPRIRATARRAMIISAGTWFALDTGFSIVMGEMEHAAFNIPFAALLVSPLYVMSTTNNSSGKDFATFKLK